MMKLHESLIRHLETIAKGRLSTAAYLTPSDADALLFAIKLASGPVYPAPRAKLDNHSRPVPPAKAASSRAVDLTGATRHVNRLKFTLPDPWRVVGYAGEAIRKGDTIRVPIHALDPKRDPEKDGFVTVYPVRPLGEILAKALAPLTDRESEAGPYARKPGFLTYEGDIRSGWTSLHPQTRGVVYVAKEAAEEAVKYGWVRVANNPTQTNDGPCWMMQR